MSSPLSQVELDGLVQTAGGQEKAIDYAETELRRLLAECEALGGAWQGDAAMIFRSAMDTFRDSAWRVIGRLKDMHQLMVSTHGVFNTTNQGITDAAKGVANVAGGGLPGL